MAACELAHQAYSGFDGVGLPVVEVKYKIFESTGFQDSMASLYAQPPETLDIYLDGSRVLSKVEISVEELAHHAGAWEGRVTYGLPTFAPIQVSPEDGPELSFDTTGESKRILASRSTIASYPDGVAPDSFKIIGVSKDGIEGVDITVPSYRWSESHLFTVANCSAEYRKRLAELTGSVPGPAESVVPFRGWEAGEVLFLGASGSRRGLTHWQVTFNFAAVKNETGLTLGDLEGIRKRGFEYLWWRTLEQKIGTATDEVIAHAPSYAYVEEVYPYADFFELGIGMDPL